MCHPPGANDSGAAATATATPLPGGSEQDLLKWALAHSDADELRAAAAEARAAAGSPEFQERQRRVQQLLEAMKGEATEAELMREAVGVLADASSSRQQLAAALRTLRHLVEPIDAANNLQGMGGLAPVVALLRAGQPAALQAGAAHLLATAASNNHAFLGQLLGDHPDVPALLLDLLRPAGRAAQAGGEEAEAGVKALHCLSAVLRLSAPARAAFYEAGGGQVLHALLQASGGDPRLQRKALGLLTDLVAALREGEAGQQQGQAAGLDRPAAVDAALRLLDTQRGLGPGAAGWDVDLQEKALLAVQALVEGPFAAAAAARVGEAGGGAVLAALQAGLRAAAAAEPDGEGEFLLEVAELVARVRERAAAGSRDEL